MVAKPGSAQVVRVRRGTMDETAPVTTKVNKKKIVRKDESPVSAKGPQGEDKREPSPVDASGGDEGMSDAPPQQSGGDGAASLVAIAPATSGKEVYPPKRARPDAPKFLLMLYEILQNESPKIIRWTDDGLALQILEQNDVTEFVLPKYFNHTNFHSFQRQLNYFGFRKWTKSKTDICTFSHPYFRRNQPELMHLIKRKKATRRVATAEPSDMSFTPEALALASSVAVPKKLLPLSPSGKRKHPISEGGEDAGKQGPPRPNVPLPSLTAAPASGGITLPALSNGLMTLASLNTTSGSAASTTSFPSTAGPSTRAISPASGGAKKKAKTGTGGSKATKSTTSPQAPLTTSPVHGGTPNSTDLAGQGNQVPILPLNKVALPNIDIVRNRMLYRPQQPGIPTQVPGFANTFGAPPPLVLQHPQPSAENPHQGNTTPTQPSGGSSTPVNESNSTFTNSFSDPVDILLRIKKSRAMSQDNTQMQSPQHHGHGQAEGFASLQNFLLTQSLYTNRLESQLKLALEENEALRQLVDSKHREVEALTSERKMLQNENAVLTEDKNKLFEINRDLLSKLFPQ